MLQTSTSRNKFFKDIDEKVPISYSDAVAYMLRAATVIEVFYPNLIHFTSLAHGLKHIAKEVRAKFSQVKKLILMGENCF
jgi:hypothetical protein